MIELKRGFRNKCYLYMILLNILCLVIGFIYLVFVKKNYRMDFFNLSESIYSVYTQLGMLIFSPVIIYQYSNDYRSGNIEFYRYLEYTASRYLIEKIIMLIAYSALGVAVTVFAMSIFTGYFRYSIILFVKIESVMLYYCIVASVFGYLFKNFMSAFFMNMAVWIFGILLSRISESFRFFAYFDISKRNHREFIDVLNCRLPGDCILENILDGYIFIIFAVIIAIVIGKLFEDKWSKEKY